MIPVLYVCELAHSHTHTQTRTNHIPTFFSPTAKKAEYGLESLNRLYMLYIFHGKRFLILADLVVKESLRRNNFFKNNDLIAGENESCA